MATSPYNDTAFILDFLGHLIWGKKASVLDVGAGFGRWGFLCRCHMAGGRSLTAVPGQDLQIDAIEAWEANISPVYDCVYNHVFRADAREILPALGIYDVIISSHCIEHFGKKDAWQLIDEMKKHTRKALIIALPFGAWPQEAVDGNPFEQHKSEWFPEEFYGREWLVREFGKGRHSSGVAICAIDTEAMWQIKVLGSSWKRFLASLAVRFCGKQRA